MFVKYEGPLDLIVFEEKDLERVKLKGQKRLVFSKRNGFVAEVSEETGKYLIEKEQGFSEASEEDRETAAKTAEQSVPAPSQTEPEQGATPGGSPAGGSPRTTTGGSTEKPVGGGAV